MTAGAERRTAGKDAPASDPTIELDRAIARLAGADASPPLPAAAIRGRRRRGQSRLALLDLSPRLVAILDLVAADRSDGEIAASLGLSVRLVANHRESLMTRFGVRDRRALVRYARRVSRWLRSTRGGS